MLLNATNDIVKCTEPPKHVQMNAMFLIDLRYIPLDDLRAADCHSMITMMVNGLYQLK